MCLLSTRHQIHIRENFRIVQSQVPVHQRATFLALRRRVAALGRLAAVAALTVALAACERTSPTESVLYSFGTGNVPDGRSPNGGLVMDASGNLYGTTAIGGTDHLGTVFKITPSGVESVLHSFGTGNVHDGKYPNGGMVMDASGNIYGTTVFGGTANKGTVFKITPSGVESVLHSFGTVHGTVFPHGGMVMDASGNLYGTTVFGGTNNLGTVFKITPSGVESTFYSFSGNDSNDGDQPNGGLVMAASGNLYGTTIGGGTDNLGTVFKITPSGVESVLYSFGGGYDGSGDPNGGLVMDASGNLYGTAGSGGKLGIIGYLTVYLSRILGTPSPLSGGLGTVFKITPSGVESVLHSFGTGNVWQSPNGGMVMAASGNIYGTTRLGGTDHSGTVFRITP